MRIALSGLMLAGIVSGLHAQDVPGTVLVDSAITAGRDTLPVVELLKANIYRIEVTGSAATPVFVPAGPRVAHPDLIALSGSGAVSRYEVVIYRDGPYRITLTGSNGIRTHVLLYADSVESAEKRTRAAAPKIGVGLAFNVGYHGAYAIDPADLSSEASAMVDACLLFSDGRRLSLCLGAGRHFRTGESLFLVFAEPRLSVLRLHRNDGNVMDLGVVARFAQGSAGSVNIDPSFYAGGIFFSYGMSRNTRGHGTGLQVSAMYGPVRNVAVEHQSIVQATVGFWWVP